MAEGSAKKQDIKGSYGEGFVIMGGDRIEVSPDGKKLTAYPIDGVETKAASGEAPAQGISISADFNTVVLNGATIERAADGHLVISTPGIVITNTRPGERHRRKSQNRAGDWRRDGRRDDPRRFLRRQTLVFSAQRRTGDLQFQ